ncbi:MAG: uroporphyrinogen decarboxylase family protein [Elusimicrobia bacterium]|nr:uroporphyrinogen decarboxylase family protein [Elusimicrobiota bacterium]
MNSKERMLAAMFNKKADMVPVAPDISNMIPCKLTGKPFWDIYLYENPSLWKAYIDAVKHFGFDGWACIYIYLADEKQAPPEYKRGTVIVSKSDERIITRGYKEKEKNKKEWSEFVTVYYKGDPPSYLKASKIDMQLPPEKFLPIEGVQPRKNGIEYLKEVKEYMGNDGVVGVSVDVPALSNPEGANFSIYDYYDRYDEVKEWALKTEDETVKGLKKLLAAEVKPDYILIGISGLLIFNTPKIVRELTLSSFKKITKMCKEAGIPSQIHCCGPEKALIEMCAEETDLNSINPLEIPPMGDCILKEIKEKFGKKLSLMGNLHTTEVMLKGSTKIVEDAAKKAIDDAAEDGGFILSTGDQCGRDTPEENIFKMIEVARTYGKY